MKGSTDSLMLTPPSDPIRGDCGTLRNFRIIQSSIGGTIMETRIDSYYFAGSYIGCRLYTDGQHAVTGEGEEGSKWIRKYCLEFGLKPTIFNRIDV